MVTILDLYRQARARMARQVATIGAQAQKRRAARVVEQLHREGVLLDENQLPALLRNQAD